MSSRQTSAITSAAQLVHLLQTVQPDALAEAVSRRSARTMQKGIVFIFRNRNYKVFQIVSFKFQMGNKINTNNSDESAVEIVQRKAEMEFEQEDFIRQIQGSIESEYEVLSPCLQQNEFYELRKVIHIKTRLVRAVYIVNKYKIRSHERELFELQIRKLKKIDHPAVSKIYELFKNDHRFFVVMEYKHGASLADALEEQRYFEESAAAGVIWQLLGLLGHCHKRGITHTDLKLTSICFNSKRHDNLKVMDFSISKIFRVEEVVDQSIGRAVLSAPETVSGQTSSKSDVWSCGIILFILLCGEPPIIANTRNKLIHKFKSFFLRFRERRFRHVSEEGKDMVRRMLRINPNERPSADELMGSGWFIRFMRLPRLPAHSLHRCLKELYFFSPSSKLQEATWAFFVNSLISYDEKNLIMTIFLRLDKSSKGELDHQDLCEGFLQLTGEKQTAEACATKIFNRLRKNKIVFSQFVTYCANRFFLIREVNLIKIFEVFDEDGSGEIQVSQLRDTLGNSKQVREEVWVQLVREANDNSGAKLSLQQFGDMIRQLNYADRESILDPDHTFIW